MYNLKNMLGYIELQIELVELKDYGLTYEELCGFIDMFCDKYEIDIIASKEYKN